MKAIGIILAGGNNTTITIHGDTFLCKFNKWSCLLTDFDRQCVSILDKE